MTHVLVLTEEDGEVSRVWGPYESFEAALAAAKTKARALEAEWKADGTWNDEDDEYCEWSEGAGIAETTFTVHKLKEDQR